MRVKCEYSTLLISPTHNTVHCIIARVLERTRTCCSSSRRQIVCERDRQYLSERQYLFGQRFKSQVRRWLADSWVTQQCGWLRYDWSSRRRRAAATTRDVTTWHDLVRVTRYFEFLGVRAGGAHHYFAVTLRKTLDGAEEGFFVVARRVTL